MSKVWTQREDGTGWWASMGRVTGRSGERWFELDRKRKVFTLTFFGLFGLKVDWNLGPYVSVGASYVGYAGLGYVSRRRYDGPTSKDWKRHDELRSKVIT